MFETKLLIGGEWKAAKSGATFVRTNPVTGQPATTAAAGNADDAKAAIEAAKAAFPAWSATGPAHRRKIIQAAAARLRERSGDFAARVSAETGSTIGWGHFNVAFGAALLDEAAAITTQVSGEVIPSDHPGVISLATRQPAGVVFGMAPWNAPVILGVRAVAVPLAVGNTVILKGSEICPATHALIAEVLMEAGVPAGVINYVCHSAADAPVVAETSIAHPAVRRVNFTGSTRVGRIVSELAGRHLKPAVLELGGKAPLVVLDDADLDEAVASAAFGAFMHQGQICMATQRVIVDEAVADAFVEKFKVKALSLETGDPTTSSAPLAAVFDTGTVVRCRRMVADAVAKGAALVCGGEGEGVFFQPTILDRVKPGMEAYAEEAFGPVVSVIRASGDDHAVELANDSEYGLSSAVYGRDINRALGVAQRIESGICHVNGPTVQDEAQIPFGGVKSSGYGRFGGRAGIEAFTETRWITIETHKRHFPI